MVILSLVQFEKRKKHFVQISTLKLLHLFSKKKSIYFIYCIMTHVLVVI